MARIRTIKPEFFTSEDITDLTPFARLFYIALWCEADREGRLEWKLKTFKMRYLPADDCVVADLAAELINAGLVVIYEVDGKTYAEIPTFKKHQVINNRESESQIPARDDHAKTTRQPRVKAEGKGKEGKEGDSTELLDGLDADVPPPPAVALIPLNDGTEHPVFEKQVLEWQLAYPAVDVSGELLRIRTWCDANRSKRKTKTGVDRFLVTWLSRVQNQGGNRGGGWKQPDSDDWTKQAV